MEASAASPPPSRSHATTTAVLDAQEREAPRSPEHERLHASFQDDRHYLDKMVALDISKRSDRIDAILKLKGSIDKSSSAIQSKNAQVHRQTRELHEEDARRFHELLSQGLNPYEVARKRTVQEAALNERKQLESKIQSKQVALLQHLEVEMVWKRRQDRVAQEQRAYEKKYQKEMGRAATEERTKQYLVARTGREIVDPTGKAVRLYPSQETAIKDHSFGLGKNLVHDAVQRHQIVNKVHRKRSHRTAADVAPNPVLLPRLGDSNNSNNNNADCNAPPLVPLDDVAGITPGEELRQLNHSMLDADTAKRPLPPLAKSTSRTRSESDTTTKKGFGKPHRSVLEQRMLEQAREKQKSNVFQKQVVWGKEFTGCAFLADPPEIWFKDYEVGVPMTQSFTLTNVSNTFNHFKLLELDETLRECFVIQFEKPGRMSAGMSCRITITFTAIQTADIDSCVPALAQTGLFSIPLRCTCKKAVPVLEMRALSFKDVVAGEKQVLTLQLENRGALPLDFRVRRLRKSQERQGPELDEDEDVRDIDNVAEAAEADPRDEELVVLKDSASLSMKTADDLSPLQEDSRYAAIRGEELAAGEGPVGGDSNEPSVSESPEDSSSSAATDASIGAASTSTSNLFAQRLPLSTEEEQILNHARASTLFKPEGADTPLRHTLRGSVAPYGSSTVAFTFAPAEPMDIENEQFLIEFPDATAAYRAGFWSAQLLAPMVVAVSAQSTHVPIFVQQPELDFRCCLYDRLYRHQLVLCNRGRVALKMQLRVPKALDGCVEFHPNMGFVQGTSATASNGDRVDDAAGTFPVQIKFRPNAGMWKRIEAKSLGSEALGFLAVPVQVVVPDQVVPVYVILIARISSAALAFSPKRLDFGACALGHSVSHTLRIMNSSRLAQRLAFIKLPPELRLESAVGSETNANAADDGVAMLLPSEEKTFRVVYQPTASATSLASRLTCRTTMNDDYAIAVVGECVATPLAFSHSVVRLAATQLGQMQTFSIACANKSGKPQTMELVVPLEAASVLRVTPTVATVMPHSSQRVEIEFRATAELFEIQESEYASRDDKQTAPAHSVTAQSSRCEQTKLPSDLSAVASGLPTRPPWVETAGVPAEERSVHHTWSVFCFRQSSATASSLVAFQVCTTAIEAKLYSTPKDLDFGQVAIGQTLIQELTFTNNSLQSVLLRAKPLHALGGFRLVNSPQRVISARGGERVVRMEFRPSAPLVYDDELELSCLELGVIRVGLRGEGVNPSLRMEPEDGYVDFGDVLARNRATSELRLTNASAFPLTLAILPLQGEKSAAVEPTASSGLPVFTFSPSQATIPAQTTLTVKVLFSPDHERPQQYHHQYLIQVPNESERHVVSLSGRCWENQLYVYNPQQPLQLFAPPAVEDLFDVPPSVSLASLLDGAGTAAAGLFNLALSAPGIKKAGAPLTLVFDSDTLASEVKTVFVGSTLPPNADEDYINSGSGPKGAGAAAGSFEFSIEDAVGNPQYAKLFTLEPLKGAISAAQQLPIHITYLRPAVSSDGHQETAAQAALAVAQWIQVRVACKLKGGALWRPLPSVSAATGTVPAPAPAPAAPGKGSAMIVGSHSESDVRIVHLVLRAKMIT